MPARRVALAFLLLLAVVASPAFADVPPVVTAPATSSAVVGTLTTFNVSASDPDGDAIASLTAAPLPSGATFTSNASSTSGTFSWTPSLSQQGTYSVTFTASNALSGSSTTAISVGPNEGGVPVVTAPATVSGNEGTLITFTATATDPDGQAITSFLASGPAITAGATFTSNATKTSGTFSWTPTFTQAGSYAVTFTASNSLSGTATTSITVTNVDRAPVVTAPASITGETGHPLTFSVTAADPDGNAITSLAAAPLPSGASFTANAANTSGTFAWTPTLAQGGNYSVGFTASNALSRTATTTITVTAGGDTAPLVTAPASASGNETEPITFTVSASDPDSDPIASLTAAGTAIDAGGTFTSNATHTSGTFGWTPTAGQLGNYSATFTASNTLSGSATTAISVTVNVDHAPVVTAPVTWSAPTNTLITFNVTASDPDGDAISSLTAAPLPTGATFTSNAAHTSGTFSWTPTNAQNGTFNVTFTASNALSSSASTAISVTVSDRAPIVTAPATRSVAEGMLLTFTVTASDPDADAITSLTAAPLPAGASFTANATNTSGTFSWTPTFAQPGVYSITFTAQNALSGSATTTVCVGCADRAPVVTAPTSVQFGESQLGIFTVTAADPDGDAITSLTATGTAITAGATFTKNATNTSGTLTWTPTFSTPWGTYTATFTASNALTGSATTSIVVGQGAPRPPVVTAPATFQFGVNVPGSFTVTASDPDGEAITSFTATGTAITAGATFTKNAANTSGTLSWTPTFSQSGSYSVTFTASNSLSGSATTSITVGQLFQPPVVTAPASVSGSEGTPITFVVTAVAPDGSAIVSLTATPLPVGATFSVNAAHTSGTFSWTPNFSQSGTYTVTFTASNSLSGSASTVITVQDTCPLPVADAGGPYLGAVGSPILFDGSGSSDPSGSPLTYAWDFGDGTTGVGVTVSHSYALYGTYTVTLTVQGACGSATDVTTASMIQFCALAFSSGGNRTLRLSSGKQTWCVQVEPTGGCYANADVDLSSVVMQYGGGAVSEIHAISGKTAISGDRNGNGIEEITACFSKDDLRLLFSALPQGESVVTVTIRMDLVTGGQVNAQLTVRVFSSGAALAARIAPNPFNPRATLSFRTTRAGFARASLFDASGRLVRTLLNERSLPTGYHDVPVDGRGEGGEALASGIYLYRLETSEGTAAGRVVLLK